MASQRRVSRAMLRLPVVLFVVAASALLVTAIPADTGDTTADNVLGQIDFTHSTANFVDAKGLFLEAPGGVAFDLSGHVYVTDPSNNRVLGYDILSNLNDTAGAPAAILV